MTEKKELKGIGGFLAFLIISLGLLSPAVTVYGYYTNVILAEQTSHVASQPVWGTFKMIAMGFMLAGCVLFWLAAYGLFRHHVWRSVRRAILAMWVAYVGLDVLAMAVFYIVFGKEFVLITLQGVTGDAVRSLIYPSIWTLYLLRSRRVRNTYRRESDLEEMARYMGMKE